MDGPSESSRHTRTVSIVDAERQAAADRVSAVKNAVTELLREELDRSPVTDIVVVDELRITDAGGWLTLHARRGEAELEYSRIVARLPSDPTEPEAETVAIIFLSGFEEAIATRSGSWPAARISL